MVDALAISGATKRFGETVALRGVDLTFRAREWLALLGPTGAGRTTLVRAVAGRVRLDGGEMHLLGEVLDGSAAAEPHGAAREGGEGRGAPNVLLGGQTARGDI